MLKYLIWMWLVCIKLLQEAYLYLSKEAHTSLLPPYHLSSPPAQATMEQTLGQPFKGGGTSSEGGGGWGWRGGRWWGRWGTWSFAQGSFEQGSTISGRSNSQEVYGECQFLPMIRCFEKKKMATRFSHLMFMKDIWKRELDDIGRITAAYFLYYSLRSCLFLGNVQ